MSINIFKKAFQKYMVKLKIKTNNANIAIILERFCLFIFLTCLRLLNSNTQKKWKDVRRKKRLKLNETCVELNFSLTSLTSKTYVAEN